MLKPANNIIAIDFLLTILLLYYFSILKSLGYNIQYINNNRF